MTGKVLTTGEHRCFMMFPLEAGVFAAVGTQWQCDDCQAIWTLVKGKGWVQQ